MFRLFVPRALLRGFFPLLLLFLFGCIPPELKLRYHPEITDPVRVGAVLPLSGPLARQGQQMLAGVQFGIDELNSSRGLFGRRVELVVVDSLGTQTGARRAFESAAAAGVIGVVGGYSTSEAKGMCPKARELRIPLVLIRATGNDEDILLNPFVYRVAFTNSQQAEMISGYLWYYRKIHRIAIAVNADPQDLYSSTVARDVAAAFRDLGGGVFGPIKLNPASPDKALQELASCMPGAIVLPFAGKTGAELLKKLRAGGYPGILCGPDGWDDVEFFHALKGMRKVGDCFYTALGSIYNKDPEYLRFRREFRKKRFYYPDSTECQSYDALRLLLIGFGNNATDLIKFDRNCRSVRKQPGAAATYTILKENQIDRTIYINDIGFLPQMPETPCGRLVAGLPYSRLKDYAFTSDDSEEKDDFDDKK